MYKLCEPKVMALTYSTKVQGSTVAWSLDPLFSCLSQQTNTNILNKTKMKKICVVSICL